MALRRSLLALVVAAAPAAALAQPASAMAPAPKIAHATMVYYVVGGTTANQVRARIDKRRPVASDGSRYDAFTHWEYRWNWPGYGTSSCTLSQARVTVRVTVSFPRWSHPKGSAPTLPAAWARYSKALARHEKGHVDYAVARYPAVVRAIKNSTCAGADKAATAQLNLIRRHDVAYDASTRHGATQGARFP
jgi:predicted secreted Zn-dependent protease